MLCLAGGCAVSGQKQRTPSALPDYPKIDLAVGYEVDPNWPCEPAKFKWGAMSNIAVDADDQIWLLNRGRVPVQVYTADGRFLYGWGEGQFEAAHGLRIDDEGNVWAGDVGLHVVRKFTPQGELLLTLGTPGEPGEDETHLNRPTDMAITPAGDIFVSDGYGNSRIVHFDAQGRFVKAWGKLGVEAGELSLPHGIGLDSKGRLYVAERNNGRIQVFDQSGKSLAQWRNLVVPWSICITPDDEVLVCGSSPARWAESEGNMLGILPQDQLVIKFNTDGRVLELWAFPSGHERPGELDWVHGIAVDSRGNLYLGDVRGNRAQKFIRRPAQR